MVYLLVVTIIWGFSFGLIKNQLSGLDASFIAFARLFISFLVFLPFLKIKNLNQKLAAKFIVLGAVQYGVMYLFYLYAFQYLKAYQVALFTIFTPLYIAIINDIIKREFNPIIFLTSLASVFGTAIIVYRGLGIERLIFGFMLVQISNLAFALGQVYYKKLTQKNPQLKDHQIFSLLYFGAVVISGLSAGFTVEWINLSLNQEQLLILIYLGAIASGLCFFLWNYGVRRTKTGTYAVFNNLKIPMAIVISLLFFGEQTDILRLLLGMTIIILALVMNEKFDAKSPAS